MPVPGFGEPHRPRFRSDEDELLRRIANREGRSVNDQIKYWVLEAMKFYCFKSLWPYHLDKINEFNFDGK